MYRVVVVCYGVLESWNSRSSLRSVWPRSPCPLCFSNAPGQFLTGCGVLPRRRRRRRHRNLACLPYLDLVISFAGVVRAFTSPIP